MQLNIAKCNSANSRDRADKLADFNKELSYCKRVQLQFTWGATGYGQDERHNFNGDSECFNRYCAMQANSALSAGLHELSVGIADCAVSL